MKSGENDGELHGVRSYQGLTTEEIGAEGATRRQKLQHDY